MAIDIISFDKEAMNRQMIQTKEEYLFCILLLFIRVLYDAFKLENIGFFNQSKGAIAVSEIPKSMSSSESKCYKSNATQKILINTTAPYRHFCKTCLELLDLA